MPANNILSAAAGELCFEDWRRIFAEWFRSPTWRSLTHALVVAAGEGHLGAAVRDPGTVLQVLV